MDNKHDKLQLCYVADITNIHVRRWIDFFVQRGHKVTCLSDKEGTMTGVNVVLLPNRDSLLADKKRARKADVVKARAKVIKAYCKEHQPDVVHAIFLYIRGWSAAYANVHPLVITLLGSDVYLPKDNYRNGFHLFRDKLFNAYSLRQADLVTAVSNDLKVKAEKMTFHQVTTELIPIGTDEELFQPDIDTTDLRKKLDIDDEAYVVLSPRQITPLYNQDTIIKSIPMVLEKVPNAVFVLKDTFCETPERQAYVAKLKDMAETLNVDHAIRWDAEVPLKDLPAYYNLADVIVSTPSTDGMPVTLFDAMACRKPVIVGDLPSYNDVIINGQTGVRVPVRNEQALAQAITRLAENPETVQRIVEESQVILQEYGVFKQQMMRMDRYYYGLAQDLLSSKPSIPRFMGRLIYRALVNLN